MSGADFSFSVQIVILNLCMDLVILMSMIHQHHNNVDIIDARFPWVLTEQLLSRLL
jgi:hypothetical protein